MARVFNHKEFEAKWQKKWRESGIYKADSKKKNKFYSLVELTYTSGDLHIGHWFAWSAPDAYARFKRMQGYNVLFPVGGFDAFGLPAENAAIKHGEDPKRWTLDNVKRMREQFATMGPSFDWDKEVITCDPDYYRWTQWLFLKLYEAGLVYRANVVSNWCPKCQTVLANEHVVNGCCWRHDDTKVIQKEVLQWLVKITKYADKLIWPQEPKVDWPKEAMEGQNNWIGRSEGIEIKFPISNSQFPIRVFTTRPDTIFGATFIVLAPEHPLVEEIMTEEHEKEVKEYVEKASHKLERERLEEAKEKTGVFTGAYAVNPLSGQKIPVWVADFVLMNYGTGAIMAVPGHDVRDFEFAKKFNLPVVEVIEPTLQGHSLQATGLPFTGEGKLMNSGDYTGLDNEEAKKKVSNYIISHQLGENRVNYHLRDWTISRQRYWGAPTPIIYCGKCGVVPVPEEDLPVLLPENIDFTPTGKPPLASDEEWLKVKCPSCGGEGRREAETLDTYVDSSWYFLRYPDPTYQKGPFSPESIKAWLPAKVYFGGTEHILGHTLYARFITKVLHDLGYLHFDEFAEVRKHHGVIMGPDGHRMSKSRGNVVNPDEQVEKYGADAVRSYLCFLGPHDKGGTWQLEGIEGMSRFLGKVWRLAGDCKDIELSEADAREVESAKNKTIKRVTEDIERFQFNTPLARLMEFTNLLYDKTAYGRETADKSARYAVDGSQKALVSAIKVLVQLLAPFAPHMAEEIWVEVLGQPYSVHTSKWPEYDVERAKDEQIDIAIQVNGKLRGNVTLLAENAMQQDKVEKAAAADAKVSGWLKGKEIKNVIFVPGRIINFVV